MKSSSIKFSLLVLFALALSACEMPATATPGSTGRGFAFNWYVETTGSNGNTCEDPVSPCETIRGVFDKIFDREASLAAEYPDLLSVSHTVYVGPGSFDEPGMARSLIHMTGSAVSIIGSGPTSTVLDAGGLLGGVFINTDGNVRIEGMNILNTTSASASGCIEVRGDGDVVIEDVNLDNCWRSGITHRGNGLVELINVNITNAIDENTDPAFTLSGNGVDNRGEMQISGGVISSNEFSGIANYGRLSLTGTTIENNQFYGLRTSYVGEVNLTDAIISSNGLSGSGIGLLISEGVVNVNGGSFMNNNNRAISVGAAIMRMTGTSIGAHDVGAMIIYDTGVVELDEVSISSIGAAADFGAAIWNYGNLTITNSHINNNNHIALYNDGPAFAIVFDTEFRDNTAGDSVIINNSMARLLLSRSLIADNETGIEAALSNSGELDMVNSTVSGNSGRALRIRGVTSLSYSTIADNTGDGLLADGPSPFTIENTLLARNAGGDCQQSLTFHSAITFSGVNVDSDGTCGFLTSYSPDELHLGPLQDNGGPTETHELLTSPLSPIIDAATGGCPSNDQRNYGRPFGPGCDVGAFEAGGTALSFEESEEEEIELATVTPTPGQDIIIVITDAGCYSGPGAGWVYYSTLKAGTQAQIVGQGFGGGWMVIVHPDIANTNCWIDLDFVEFDIPLDQLRLIAVPDKPTATPSPVSEQRNTDVPASPTPCPTDPQLPGTCQ